MTDINTSAVRVQCEQNGMYEVTDINVMWVVWVLGCWIVLDYKWTGFCSQCV